MALAPLANQLLQTVYRPVKRLIAEFEHFGLHQSLDAGALCRFRFTCPKQVLAYETVRHLLRERDQVRGTGLATVEKNDEIDVSASRCIDRGPVRSAKFDGWRSIQSGRNICVGDFREELRGRGTKTHPVTVSQHVAASLVVEQIAAIVRYKLPAGAGARVGQRALSSAGVATEQNATTINGDAGCVNRSGKTGPELACARGLKERLGEVARVRNRGRRDDHASLACRKLGNTDIVGICRYQQRLFHHTVSWRWRAFLRSCLHNVDLRLHRLGIKCLLK